MDNKKLSESTDKEIAEQLQKIYFIIGLRTEYLPNNDQAKTLISYIRTTYPLRTLGELYLAFDLYIQLKYCTDVKFYDQFTLVNLNLVMNGYRQYVNDLNSKLREVKPPEPVIPKTDIHQDIEEYLQRTDLTERDLVLIPTYIYENMLKFGYINQTEAEKIALYGRAVEKYEAKLRMDAQYFDKFAIGKLNRFLKEKETHFHNLDNITTSDIHQLYQKLSVLNEIKKRNQGNKK